MIWLIINIFVSGMLYVIFRTFPKYNIDNLAAVIINYFTASLLGFFLIDTDLSNLLSQPWIPIAFSMGGLFIFVFLMMASSSQSNGISMTSVANKMSLVIPVIAGIFLFEEKINSLIVIGILLAMISVVLTSHKEKSEAISRSGYFILGLIFIGSGVVDTLINYVKENYLQKNETPVFLMVLFFSSGILGLMWMLITDRERFRNFNRNSILGGIILGFPNFGGIYFLILALNYSGLQSSILYPINNMGIVGLSALLGILIYKEKISIINALGILLAIGAIALITFG